MPDYPLNQSGDRIKALLDALHAAADVANAEQAVAVDDSGNIITQAFPSGGGGGSDGTLFFGQGQPDVNTGSVGDRYIQHSGQYYIKETDSLGDVLWSLKGELPFGGDGAALIPEPDGIAPENGGNEGQYLQAHKRADGNDLRWNSPRELPNPNGLTDGVSPVKKTRQEDDGTGQLIDVPFWGTAQGSAIVDVPTLPATPGNAAALYRAADQGGVLAHYHEGAWLNLLGQAIFALLSNISYIEADDGQALTAVGAKEGTAPQLYIDPSSSNGYPASTDVNIEALGLASDYERPQYGIASGDEDGTFIVDVGQTDWSEARLVVAPDQGDDVRSYWRHSGAGAAGEGFGRSYACTIYNRSGEITVRLQAQNYDLTFADDGTSYTFDGAPSGRHLFEVLCSASGADLSFQVRRLVLPLTGGSGADPAVAEHVSTGVSALDASGTDAPLEGNTNIVLPTFAFHSLKVKS